MTSSVSGRPRKPRKGDRLVYTGPYAAGVSPYPPGTVVSFHTNRFHGPSVTVLLDPEPDQTGDSYADWPIAETAPDGGTMGSRAGPSPDTEGP